MMPAIARWWLKREYLAIARQAKQEHAAIYWGDEMGLRSDHMRGRAMLRSDNPRSCEPPANASVQHALGRH